MGTKINSVTIKGQVAAPATNNGESFQKPAGWDEMFALLKEEPVPAAFLSKRERKQALQERDLFNGWQE
jgi:hypothetical protein